jgi:nucleotide-binding universal stress UspA family protein
VKLDRVLVPLDGSPLAERALRTALALLRERPSATLVLAQPVVAHDGEAVRV